MIMLVSTVLGSIIKASILPVVLICVQIWLLKNKKVKKSLIFISGIAVIFVANYIFLITSAASACELKKLSADLQNDNHAEMYVIENENEEILAYSSLKIKNNEGMIVDEEDSVLQPHYQAVVRKMTNNCSFVNSAYEEEEILLNPANMFWEYEGGVYIISTEVLLKQLISLILALMLIGGVSRFLYK